jgi:polar amino acid transport system permease protein
MNHETGTDSTYQAPQPSAVTRFLNSVPFSVALYFFIIGLVAYAAYTGSESMGYNWQWYNVRQYLFEFTPDGFEWGAISLGLVETLKISTLAFVLAILIGFVIALLRLSGLIVGTAAATVFLEIVRNTPILILLYLFYYVLGPVFGWDRFVAGVLCLAIYHAALISEIFRAGINSVPVGQWEGARSIGMTTTQAYRHVVLPQSVRFILPPMTSEVVNLIKSSAIVSVIAVAELTTAGRNIISDTYMSFEIWFTVAIVYMVVTVLLSTIASHVEKRFSVS